MIQSIVQKIKPLIPTRKRGCSLVHLEILRQAQNVYCLPEEFSRLLLRIGEDGLGKRIFFDGKFEDLRYLKDEMIEILNAQDMSYPEDIFFFHGNHMHDVYLFFRTRDCEDDPAVYSVGGRWFRKEADTFSEFLSIISSFGPEKRRLHREKVRQTEYFYDPETDALLPNTVLMQ